MFRMNYDLKKNTSLTSSWKIEKKSKNNINKKEKKNPCPLTSITHAKGIYWKSESINGIQNACYCFVFYLLAIASLS